MKVRSTALRVAILILATFFFLAACGGGGGGGNSPVVKKDNSSDSNVTAATNPLRTTITTTAGTTAVLVGIVDDDLALTHPELKDQIAQYKAFGGTPSSTGSHGTAVAQVLAGKNVGYSGNAKLLFGAAANNQGSMTAQAVDNAGAWVINEGARVVNLSLGHPLSVEATPSLFGAALKSQSVIVFAAGNDQLGVDGSGNVFSAGNENIRNLSLFVGALATDASKADYSNFAGASTAVQSRFLVALGLNKVEPLAGTSSPTQQLFFEGTSSAAPVVSAAAASLFALWPHLNGVEVSNLLLATADQSFSPLYAQNTCGPAQKLNCGKYTFGQGRLDLAKAMKPQGEVMLRLGFTVNSQGHSVTTTSLQLPLAFGDALKGKTLDAVVFDDYGRDYVLDLTQRMGVQQSRLSLFGSEKSEEFSSSSDMMDMSLQMDGKKGIAKLAMSYAAGQATFNLDHGLQSEQKASHFGFGLTRAALGAESTAMTTGLGMSWASTAGATFQFRSELGPAFGASRHELSATARPAKGSTVTFGQSFSAEKAFMGAAGEGALSVNSSTGSGSFLRMSQDMDGGWKAFGHAEIGSLAVKGNNTLTGFSDVRTSQFGVGVSLKTEQQTLGFAVSQPLRADRATAHFKVATGRTLDGQVNYAARSVSLTPSGRQMDLDMSFKQALGKSSSVAVQGTYSIDAGHVAGARDYGLVAKYRVAF